jgi:hypothetical protein
LERHKRFGLALEAGWTISELMALQGNLPTYEQILQRAPEVVIRAWWKRGK